MKVETPPLLWHSDGDQPHLSAALLSVTQHPVYTNLLVTAGNSTAIHVWKTNTTHASSNGSATSTTTPPTTTTPHNNHHNNSIVSFLGSIQRHDGPVNRLAFSPGDGTYLASGGDTGHVLIFYTKDWNPQTLDLANIRYVNAGRAGDAITDLSWSGAGERLVVGTMDHGVVVLETTPPGVNFRIRLRNTTLHTHFVQGVAYDPLNYYVCTASSDRTVRVWPTQTVRKSLVVHEGKPMAGAKCVDEASLQSFCRRLAWTPDGMYLIVPAVVAENGMYATYVYARHEFWGDPAMVWGGLDTVRGWCVVEGGGVGLRTHSLILVYLALHLRTTQPVSL